VVAAGLALAIAPLIVAALENYEHTFQPFLIYSRHRKVAENILLKFIVEKTIFEQECHWLLRDVNSDQGIFEAERQAQLDACYEACASALRLIDEVLRDIRTSTESLDVLLREVSIRSSIRAKDHVLADLCEASRAYRQGMGEADEAADQTQFLQESIRCQACEFADSCRKSQDTP